MLIKLILSCIIVVFCGVLGHIYANAYVERTKQIGAIISTLQMLETEIAYSATPLPLLLERVAKKSNKEIASLFYKTADKLNQKQGYTFFEAWKSVIYLELGQSVLKEEDIDILLNLGRNLGISDGEDQLKHIRLAMDETKRNYDLAFLEQSKNVKLFKNLGVLLGLTITIVFF